ncbi:MAG: hypothetical protein M1372_01835 [Patescibacteria group bacterium]|nr:hypothetical protein [Patescibacteria group bacterium]
MDETDIERGEKSVESQRNHPANKEDASISRPATQVEEHSHVDMDELLKKLDMYLGQGSAIDEIESVENQNGVIKKGSYGEVILVKGQKEALPAQPKGGFLKGFFGGKKQPAINIEAFDVANLTRRVLYEGKITDGDVAGFPRGDSEVSRVQLANILAALNKEHARAKFDTERRLRRDIPQDFGLIVSDFVEVLPADVAARMILAASDPEVSRRIVKGEGTLSGLQANDVQQVAVSAVSLLPQENRMNLFREMQRISPGNQGRAYRFFSFYVSNWANRRSDYCGQKFIEANLPRNKADEKIREVAGDIPEIGSMLRQEGSGK